jgi:DNA invertase Pin-like site-specific DNA recombinase
MIAAIYCRKSTDDSDVADGQKSVQRQLEHARAFAASKGWTVPDGYEFVDDKISGAEFEKRPGFLRLMNALKPRAPFAFLVLSEVARLGRESIETAYAFKQLSLAGVRCFNYLDGREITMESATDKFLLGAVTFAADLEREKARQRTYDAMLRKAKAGHVTGGSCFGYDNVVRHDAAGKRSHVERRINPTEAEVVRRIFQLRIQGLGQTRIAIQLNAERAPAPKSQQGRPTAWSPASVREVLFRDLYRGVITWNKSKKRNAWGQKYQTYRPENDWLQVPAPHLEIVSEAVWQAAHERVTAARAAAARPRLEVPAGQLCPVRALRRRPACADALARPSTRLLLRLHDALQAWSRGVPTCRPVADGRDRS